MSLVPRSSSRRRVSHAVAVGLVSACAVWPFAAPAAAATLPGNAAPSGMSVADLSGGGRILQGALPKSASGVGALRTGLRRARRYFDAPPHVIAARSSTDGSVGIALFDATIRSRPVEGLIVATVGSGASHIAYLFDEPSHLAQSLPAMEAALKGRAAVPATAPVHASTTLEGAWDAAYAKASGVALSPVAFPDNSASAGVAAGFTAQPAQMGGFTAHAADGAFLRIGGNIAMSDPGSGPNVLHLPSVPYTPDMAAAWTTARRASFAANSRPAEDLTIHAVGPVRVNGMRRSAMIFGTAVGEGKRLAYEALVTTTAPQRGLWFVDFTIMWAPPDQLAIDAPRLFAMLHSYRGNQAVQAQETADFNAAFNKRQAAMTKAIVDANTAFRERQAAAFNQSMQQAAENRTYISQQGAAAVNTLTGNVVVFDDGALSPGGHRKVSLADSDRFVAVPIDRLREGTDY
jgi:hypothetical protein